MKKKWSARVLALCAMMLLTACGGTISSGTEPEGYPVKTITMIVPYSAGGTTDLVGRQLAAALGKALDVSVVVENRAGASGSVGCQAVLDAEKNGSVVLFTADSLGTQRVMGISEMSYADFAPIAVVANDPKVVVTGKDSPYADMEDLLREIKARPGAVQMAYTGPGGSGHVQALIMEKCGFTPALTAYSGGSDGIIAVMSGQVAFTNANYSAAAPYLESGDLRLLAVCTAERMADHPDVPTLSEVMSGSEEYLSIPYTPLSLLVAAEVPEETQTLLREGCTAAFQDPDFISFMESNHIEKLYEQYTTVEEMQTFYTAWESRVSWLLYDAGAASFSPEQFGIARPAD